MSEVTKTIPDKTIAEARFFWSEITSGSFDQKTITGLLLACRFYITASSPTREVADFVAHCEKDRGEIHDRFEALRFLVNGQETPKVVIGAETTSLAIQMPIPIKDTCFTEDLKRSLIELKLFEKGEVESTIDTRANELNLCYLAILHFAKLVVKGKPDAFIKLSWVLGFGKPDTHLSLRWIRGGTNQLVMATKLRPFDWCDFNPLELDKFPSVRAIRGPDGLKLRKV